LIRVKWLMWFFAVALVHGGVVHVRQLATGGYPWAPAWLAAYYTSLTVFDLLAAALLLLRRPIGVRLAVAVLVTDALANGYATYGLHLGGPLARTAQAVVSVIALLAVATSAPMRTMRTD
jgi:hypothetical protein